MSEQVVPPLGLDCGRARRGLRAASLWCGLALLAVALAEAALRAATGAPHGTFRGWFPGRLGLYPESSEIVMPGVVSWRLHTNRWGFRGAELERRKVAALTRIAMVGDSVTDGFLVDDEDTYPAATERSLRAQGRPAEVMNAACGGATIDRELAILREAVTPFAPDVVVLTFVTNDVHVLLEMGDGQLFGRTLSESGRRARVQRALLRTALGEWALDSFLRLFSSYRPQPRDPAGLGPARYQRTGGADFQANARAFLERHRGGDSEILGETLAPPMVQQLERYLQAWDRFVAHARQQRMAPVFVYFPAYSQVYLPGASFRVRDRLQRHSLESGVPFLDLTPALRGQGQVVLHLAPDDFHLNPRGNAVIGAALAGFLAEQGLAPQGARP